MTISASYTEKIGDRLPSPGEQEAANHLRKILAAHASSSDNNRLKIVDPAGNASDVILTPALSELLIELLGYIGKGDAVTLVPVTQKLTTQQAADILNVSRPYFVGLLEKGEIPFELVGRHRRVAANDLFNYKNDRDKKRAKAMEELALNDADYI
ncbi:MAG: excisionase family DNA-binding protein [Woeseia sp.]